MVELNCTFAGWNCQNVHHWLANLQNTKNYIAVTSYLIKSLAWTLTFGLCHPTLIGFQLVITFVSLLMKRCALSFQNWLIDKVWRHTCSRNSIGDVTLLGYLVYTQNVVTFTFCIDWHWVIDHNCKLICSNVSLFVIYHLLI